MSAPEGQPLTINLCPASIEPGKSFYPSTHLQLSWLFPGASDIEVFTDKIPVGSLVPDQTTLQRSLSSPDEDGATAYTIVVPRGGMPLARIRPGAEDCARISLYAWRGERTLGQWDVGTVPGLALAAQQ